jgi:hypothetical protein
MGKRSEEWLRVSLKFQTGIWWLWSAIKFYFWWGLVVGNDIKVIFNDIQSSYI